MPLLEHESRVCARCWNSMTRVGKTDYTIAVLKQRFDEGGVVEDLRTMFYFEKGKVLQQLAHCLKYEEITAIGFELGARLSEQLKDKNFDAVVPIPLNKRKERERGYNQSDFIARGIASVIRIPVVNTVLRRVKYTVTQTRLNAEQRKENMSEAFEISNGSLVREKHILLVDDVITTGSTIQEAAKVLRQAGAASVTAGSAGLAKLGEDV